MSRKNITPASFKYPLFHRLLLLLGLTLSLAATGLEAQDAVASNPAFLSPETATGDAPPRFKHKVRIAYPDNLEREDVQGYTLTVWKVDPAGGRVIMANAATHPLFGVHGALSSDESAITPILKDGKSVAGLVWYSVIFNPVSAGSKKKEAAPRLLAVAPAQVPPKELGKFEATELPVTWVKLQLDATGAITSFELESPEAEKFKPAIAAALKSWRFAPASQAGEPVAVGWRAPVVLCPDFHEWVDLFAVVSAKIRQVVDPVYPRALVREKIRGTVTLSCLIDEKGAVQDIVVTSSSHPDFSEPAIAAMRNWKFFPATKAGKPVSAKLSQTIQFSPSGDPQGGRDAVNIPKATNQDKLPPEFRYDIPPRVIGFALPVYPYTQWVAKTKGKASVAMLIDATGHVSQAKVTEASSPEFGLALMAAVEECTFTPALKDGQPAQAVVGRDLEFTPSGDDILSNSDDRAMAKLLAKNPERAVPVGTLDKPLTPTFTREPIVPAKHRLSKKEGFALVEIIVDENGQVLLPRIVESSAPEFGYAAVQAVKQWVFAHPTVGGKPVNVRMQLPFAFNKPKEN